MWWFKRNVKESVIKRIPREFEVPAEKVRHLLVISLDKGLLGRFEFWKYIQDMFPETVEGAWQVEFPSATRVKVVEKFPKDE